MSKDNTKNLIEELTEDLKPMKCLCPARQSLQVFAVTLVYIVAVIFILGLRSDVMEQLYHIRFICDVVLMFFAGITAIASVSWLTIPDMGGKKFLPVVPIAFAAVFIIWTIYRGIQEGGHIPRPHWDHCFQNAVMMGFVPALFTAYMLRKGATTQPLLSSLIQMIAVGAFGYIGLRFVCVRDAVEHSALYHLFPFVVFGFIIGIIARRLYRW